MSDDESSGSEHSLSSNLRSDDDLEKDYEEEQKKVQQRPKNENEKDEEEDEDEGSFQDDEENADYGDYQDEDEDHDDGEEDDYSLTNKRKHHQSKKDFKDTRIKKKKKEEREKTAQIYLDDQAEEESDDGEEESFEDEENDFIDQRELTPGEAEELLQRHKLGEEHAQKHQLQQNDIDQEHEDILKIVGNIEGRHKLQEQNFYLDRTKNKISHQACLPSVRDPKLFLVQCKQGFEKEVVISLLQKALCKKKEGDPLSIFSATASENLKGYFYVEAYKENHVRTAIQGMRSIFKTKISLVPIKEMAEVYNIIKANKIELESGDWVRIKTGIYTGDLAQIIFTDEQMTKTFIKMIPRINILEEEGSKPWKSEHSKSALKKTKPSQRMFNHREVLNCKRKANQWDNKPCWMWNGLSFRNGFLLKYVSLKSLQINDIQPTLEELDSFQNILHSSDSESNYYEQEPKPNPQRKSQPNLQQNSVPLNKGDKVRVLKGELVNLIGTVVAISGQMITINPAIKEIKEHLNFPALELVKHFENGDHCKVISGRYSGESGLIIKRENNILHVFSETKKTEFKVFANHAKLSSEVSSISMSSSRYEVNDLISYDNNKNIGIIITIDRDILTVLDTNSVANTIRVQDVSTVMKTEKSATLDGGGNTLTRGDSVKIQEGINRGKKGTIRHIYKAHLFLYNIEFKGTFGLFVEKNKNTLLMGAELLESATGRKRQASTARRKRDELLKKKIKIRGGSWKGYEGIVIEANEKCYVIELSSRAKKITVEKSLVEDIDKVREDQDAQLFGNANTPNVNAGQRTPGYYPQSPFWNPQTPAAQSPGWNPDAVWNPASGTPKSEIGNNWLNQ